ncbi:MAG: hypothetical protein ACREUZ_05080, partial [Burkholderiales bacterium]
MEFLVLGLILVAVPLFLPLALWVALYRTRTRVMRLESALDEQRAAVERLTAQVQQLRSGERLPAAGRPAA